MEQSSCANTAECTSPPVGRSKYCSPYCRERRKYLAKKADGRYAIDNERKRAKYIPSPRPPHVPVKCDVDQCPRMSHGRGMCKMHYKRWARANGLESPPSDAWGDRRRDTHHRRRARMNGARNSDKALLGQIIDRDGLHCAWCDQPIDLSIKWPSPKSKSIDHIIPISRGGEHTLDNTRLLHFGCNSSRGNRATDLAA